MKLVYLANVGLPSDWAHSVQIMKMCEAFAENGAEVELVVAKRDQENDTSDPFAFYHIKPVFKITRLFSLDLASGSPSPLWYWLRLGSYLISARLYLCFKKYNAVYTRELYAGLFFSKIFIERHSFSQTIGNIQKLIFKRASGLVVLTSFIKSKIASLGVSDNKIIVAPDAVKMEDFNADIPKETARDSFGLDKDAYIFGYVGTLKTMGEEKGVATAIEALQTLPGPYKLFVVGGEKEDVDHYRRFSTEKRVAERVIFVGKVPHKDIPLYIAACDVVVAPFPQTEHYSYFMSPLKIFEYMAAKRPIVATALPSLREVLTDGETALLIPPGDATALAKAVERLVQDRDLSQKLSGQAYEKVIREFTWRERARRILSFIHER